MSSSRAFGSKTPVHPHLLGSSGQGGEIADLRRDVEAAFQTVEGTGMGSVVMQEFTNPAAGGAAALEAATPCTVAPRTATVFITAGKNILAACPRNVTISTTGSTPADAPATAVVTGTYLGQPQTETINVPQTVATATGVKPFSTITSVAYSAAQGTDASCSVGIGDALGVAVLPKSIGGGVTLVNEVAVGAKVTTGALTAVGLYTPASAPQGTNDYAIYYERA